MRHRQTAHHDLIRFHVDQQTTVFLVLSPATGCIGLPQCCHVLNHAVLSRQAVHMAAVTRHILRNKRRPPDRLKTERITAAAKTGKQRVNKHQFVRTSRFLVSVFRCGIHPRHFVNLNIPRPVRHAWQKHAVVDVRRIKTCRDGRKIMKFNHFHRGADGQSIGIDRHPHWLIEDTEMRVQHVAVRPQHHQMPGLVCRNQHRDSELIKDLRQIRRMHTAKRLWLVWCWRHCFR